MSDLLASKIAAVRARHLAVAVGRGVAAMVGAAVLMLAGGMLLDLFLELPRWARAGLLAIDLAVLTYLLLAHVLFPVLFGPDDDELALRVERAIPEFGTRLIASIQLGRPGAVPAGVSAQLVQAAIRQTEQMAAPMDFAKVVPVEPLAKMIAVSALIVLVGLSGFIYGGEVSSDLLQRAFLGATPVPRKTRVNCLSGDMVIAIGDPAELKAEARGVVPAAGTVEVRYASGRTQTFRMEAAEGNRPLFSRTIENVQESFSYVVRLNDGRSERFKVQAVQRPALVNVSFTQVYPAYTRRTPEVRSPGDLSLLIGSQLQARIRANKPIRRAAARLVGVAEKEIELVVSGNDRKEIAGTIPIAERGLGGFSIRLMDDHGIWSKGETIYPVDLLPDKEPAVRILWPDRKEELATQQAKLLISFEATDDFGVDKVFVRYILEGVGDGQEKSLELDLGLSPSEDPRRVKRRHEFDLAKLRPMPLEGNAVEYWIEVHDGNNVTGPGKVQSDRYRAKIVSELEKRADLMNRLSDQLGTIDVVAQDQEKLNQNLGSLVHEKK